MVARLVSAWTHCKLRLEIGEGDALLVRRSPFSSTRYFLRLGSGYAWPCHYSLPFEKIQTAYKI